MGGFSRRTFLTLSAGAIGATAARAQFWEKRKFPGWSAREVAEMLTDSPWVRQFSLRFELAPRVSNEFSDVGLPPGIGFPPIGMPGSGWPGGGGNRMPAPSQIPRTGGSSSGGPTVSTEVYLTARWSTALPIRQALLLEEFGSASKAPADKLAALDQEPGHYLVEIFGLPAQVVQMERDRMEQALLESAQITRSGAQPIRAKEVYAPEQGNYRSISITFPRTDPISLDHNNIEIFAAAQPFEFRQKFALRPMVYNGALAL